MFLSLFQNKLEKIGIRNLNRVRDFVHAMAQFKSAKLLNSYLRNMATLLYPRKYLATFNVYENFAPEIYYYLSRSLLNILLTGNTLSVY